MRRRDSPVRARDSRLIIGLEGGCLFTCKICGLAGELVGPCDCSYFYHQTCLLLYLRGIIRRTLRTTDSLDLSTLGCQHCNHRFHLQTRLQGHYDCGKLRERLSGNCCSRQLGLLGVASVVVAVTVGVFVGLLGFFKEDKGKELFLGLLGVIIVEALVWIALLGHCLHRHLHVQQLVLERVLQTIDLHSLASSNSDDHHITDACEIIVKT